MQSRFAAFASVVAAAACLTYGPGPAAADDKPRFNHKGQFTVNIQGGAGYRALFPYDKEYCGDVESDGSGNKPNCLGRSPFALDFGFGYAVFDRFEVFTEIRIGLERDFGRNNGDGGGPRIFVISPGIRGYIGEWGDSRFFSTVQLAIDVADYDQYGESDLGVRNINGYQLDLHDTIGIYAYFGEDVSWKRWLRFEVEAGLGVQARFP